MLGNAGDWVTISDVNNPYPWIYLRKSGTSRYIVALNPGEKSVSATVNLDNAAGLRELIANGKVKVKRDKNGFRITLPGVSSAIYKVE